jgi:hypothetical protein
VNSIVDQETLNREAFLRSNAGELKRAGTVPDFSNPCSISNHFGVLHDPLFKLFREIRWNNVRNIRIRLFAGEQWLRPPKFSPDGTFRIIKITENHCPRRTSGHARRLSAFSDSMRTEGAFAGLPGMMNPEGLGFFLKGELWPRSFASARWP